MRIRDKFRIDSLSFCGQNCSSYGVEEGRMNNVLPALPTFEKHTPTGRNNAGAPEQKAIHQTFSIFTTVEVISSRNFKKSDVIELCGFFCPQNRFDLVMWRKTCTQFERFAESSRARQNAYCTITNDEHDRRRTIWQIRHTKSTIPTTQTRKILQTEKLSGNGTVFYQNWLIVLPQLSLLHLRICSFSSLFTKNINRLFLYVLKPFMFFFFF